MSVTIGIVELVADLTSHDSHGTASRRFGGNSLIEFVVRRVTDAMLLDQVAIVIHASEESDIRHLSPRDVQVYAGSQQDPLARFAAAVDDLGADDVVRVRFDHPFVDPQLIDQLIVTARNHPECDYIGFVSQQGEHAVHSRLGVFAEWCRADAILLADRLADQRTDRCDVTRFICSHPEQFRLRFIPVPALLDRADLRLTFELEEDWDHAQAILEALGPDSLDWQSIAGLLAEQPQLRQRMATLNRQTV